MRKLILGIFAVANIGATAQAQPVADFYKDKTLTLLVGHEAGTGFDIYARALMPYFGKHIPGNPRVIVQNMPGASGVTGTNWLYNIAPKDGTVLGTFSQNVIVERLFGNTAARYEAAKFQWIGNMEQSAAACAFATTAGLKSFDDIFSREVRIGAVGATGPIGQSGRALNRLFGTKLNIVYGYKGSASVKLAVQNGEVQGICGLPVSTFTSFWKDVIDSGQMKIMLQLSAKPLPELGDVTHIDKYVKTEEQRQIVDLVFGTQTLGRTFAAPAETPADRVAALRTAFMATMKDADFLAHAKKANIDLSPMSGEDVQKMVRGYYDAPPQIVEKAIAAIKPD